KANDWSAAEASVPSAQDRHIRLRVVGHRRHDAAKVEGVGDADNRPKGIGSDVGAEDKRDETSTVVLREDRIVQASLRAAHLIDQMLLADGRRPLAGELVTRQWIDHKEGALHVEKADHVLVFY